MAQNKQLNIPPIALTATLTTNLLNCNVTSVAGPVGMTMTQPYLIIRKVTFLNKTAGAVTVTLYKGLTGANTAGTEVMMNATSVPANSPYVWTGAMRLDAADFLVGGASANTSIVMQIESVEIGVSG
jgi:hypothetical protein